MTFDAWAVMEQTADGSWRIVRWQLSKEAGCYEIYDSTEAANKYGLRATNEPTGTTRWVRPCKITPVSIEVEESDK